MRTVRVRVRARVRVQVRIRAWVSRHYMSMSAGQHAVSMSAGQHAMSMRVRIRAWVRVRVGAGFCEPRTPRPMILTLTP